MPSASLSPARALEGVLPPVIPALAALMAQRPDCLSLAQGMVHWGPPPSVAATVAEALRADESRLHRYGPMAGEPEMLEAVRRELEGRRGLDLDGSALLVTAGSNMAFHAIARVLCDPGDEVIVPLPWYFNHVMAIQLAGGVPVPVQAGLIPDPGLLEAAIGPRTRAIVTVSPGNPSGVVTPPPVLAAINRLCAERGLLHISDEAYADFVHGDVLHHSPGSARGSAAHTASLFSLSKSHGMAGWRVGFAAVPHSLLEPLAKVQDTVLICPPQPCQRAALAALAQDPSWLAERLESLRPRRRQLLKAVAAARAAGLDLALVAEPDGAFYALLDFALPRCRDGDEGSEALLRHLVLDHGVAALPGDAFGLRPRPGRGVLRLSYGMLGEAALSEALQRLWAGLSQR
ncbi:MAG: aminotransferase class I/II-fold pyridoxal phosphate-dependent enzyme [Cyanobium sp.]